MVLRSREQHENNQVVRAKHVSCKNVKGIYALTGTKTSFQVMYDHYEK